MEKKDTQVKKSEDSFNRMIGYVAVFFLVMVNTYVISITGEDASVWFGLGFAVAAGIISVLVMNAIFSGQASRSKNYYVWMAALFSFFGIFICYLGLGVYPFGEKSVMIIDMHHQYSAFFSLLREKITSLDSLSFSDSVGLGSGLIPLIAYYLCSPYNIIALIFPRAYLTEAIALIEVLKVTTAGATFAIFCRGVFKKNDYGTTALSVAYALSAYFIAYSWNVMWLDCLVLLPLVAYGLYKVVHGESPLLYSISLGLAVITNYYIGYMICIFMVMWFVTLLVTEFTGLKPAEWGKKFLRFAWTSIAGGLLSMWILIPTAISLKSTSGAEDEFARDVASNFNFFELFSRSLYGGSPTERGDNLPNIYCSVLAVFMIAVFCFCKKISLKKRVGYMGLLGALVVCLSNNWLNFAFHGFHFPNDLPYRNSFLISFVMLAIAVQALDKLNEIDSSDLVKSIAVVIAAIMIVDNTGDDRISYKMIWYSLAFIMVYAAISALRISGKIKQTCALALMFAVVFVETATNSLIMIHELNENEVFTARDSFVGNYDVNKAAVSAVEKVNADGSRMEILPCETCNDDAMYDYSGLTVFASSNAKSTTTLMGKLGYAINGVNSYIYHSYVPLVDSIFNLKYVVFGHDLGNHAQLSYIDKVTDGNGNYRYIYENTLALAKCFAVNKDITYWDSESTSRYENPFEMQNSFISYAANCEPVYKMLSPVVESTDNFTAEFTESYFYADTNGGSGSFTALQTIETEAQTYIYVDCRAASEITVMMGDSSWNVTPYEPYIIDLGKLSAGTEVRVKVSADSTCSGNVFIASMDTDALNNAINKLSQHQLSITEEDDGYIKGNISVDEDCVMFTSIQYNDGWSVYVDGEKADTCKIGDSLLGVYLTPGEHKVTMKYHTSGFVPGIILTILSILILVFWATRKKLLYPLLKEYVPVLYRAVEEEKPVSDNANKDEDVLPESDTVKENSKKARKFQLEEFLEDDIDENHDESDNSNSPKEQISFEITDDSDE